MRHNNYWNMHNNVVFDTKIKIPNTHCEFPPAVQPRSKL
jgi:hypothetical protein